MPFLILRPCEDNQVGLFLRVDAYHYHKLLYISLYSATEDTFREFYSTCEMYSEKLNLHLNNVFVLDYLETSYWYELRR
jgi:hypothetical protein